jgi:hypothetical protein
LQFLLVCSGLISGKALPALWLTTGNDCQYEGSVPSLLGGI